MHASYIFVSSRKDPKYRLFIMMPDKINRLKKKEGVELVVPSVTSRVKLLYVLQPKWYAFYFPSTDRTTYPCAAKIAFPIQHHCTQ